MARWPFCAPEAEEKLEQWRSVMPVYADVGTVSLPPAFYRTAP